MIIKENCLFIGYYINCKDKELLKKTVFSVIYNDEIVDRLRGDDLINQQRIFLKPFFLQTGTNLEAKVEVIFDHYLESAIDLGMSFIFQDV